MVYSSKPLTIMMVTNNYTPYSGGVVSSLLSTGAELRRLGHRVVIVTFDFLKDGVQESDVIRLRCAARFRYRDNPCVVPWRMSAQLTKIIDDVRPDIMHVHHPFLLGVVAARIAHRRNIPLVFTHHTLYEDYVHYVPIPRVLSRPVVRWLVRRFCRSVKTIIVPGTSIAQYLAQQDIPICTVVPSGILPCFIQETYTQKLIPVDGPIELLSVSRFVPEKSIEFLLEVMARLDERYHLTLIGYGASGDALKSYAYKRLGLSSERVRFIERPSKEQMCEFYRRAHLFLFASVTETQGLVLAEAMAFGTPVIARRGPGIVDSIVSGENGYLVDSMDDMIARVYQLTSSEGQKLYNSFQREAFISAQKYHPRTTVQELVKVYRRIVRG